MPNLRSLRPIAQRTGGRVGLALSRVTGTTVALVLVLGGAAVLRLWLWLAWRPAFLGYPDAIGYIDAARQWSARLGFWNPYRPAGYPFFLHLLHAIRPHLSFAIAVQHALGLVAAAILFRAVRRFTRPWVAFLPAIIVGYSGSELYLEHAALSETLFTILMVGGLACAVRSLDSQGRSQAAWLAGSGGLIGASAPVRTVGLALLPVLAVWALVGRPSWRARLAAAGALLAGTAIVLGGWLIYEHGTTGTWSLTRTTGETLYARAAVFADCRSFTPPKGLRKLCPAEDQPHQGATFYMFDGSSPALRVYGPPSDPRSGGTYAWAPDGQLRSFAVAAILGEPLQFLGTTLEGLVKYVAPHLGNPAMLEWDHATLIKQLHDPGISGSAAPELAAYYPGDGTVHRALADGYARAARVEGSVTAVLLALMFAGMVLARGRRGRAARLMGVWTLTMLVAPVALLFYGTRYATPAYGPLAAAAAVGLDELLARVDARGRGGRRASAGESSTMTAGASAG